MFRDLLRVLLMPIKRYCDRHLVMWLDVGGDAPPPPDYSPVANASKEAAEIGAQLGREQLNEARWQYDNNMAVARPVIEQQLNIARQTADQGADYYEYGKSFRPLEQQMLGQAMGGLTPSQIVRLGVSGLNLPSLQGRAGAANVISDRATGGNVDTIGQFVRGLDWSQGQPTVDATRQLYEQANAKGWTDEQIGQAMGFTNQNMSDHWSKYGLAPRTTQAAQQPGLLRFASAGQQGGGQGSRFPTRGVLQHLNGSDFSRMLQQQGQDAPMAATQVAKRSQPITLAPMTPRPPTPDPTPTITSTLDSFKTDMLKSIDDRWEANRRKQEEIDRYSYSDHGGGA